MRRNAPPTLVAPKSAQHPTGGLRPVLLGRIPMAVQTSPRPAAYIWFMRLAEDEGRREASTSGCKTKFPAALVSRPPSSKRADLGGRQGGLYYRPMVARVSTE